MLTARKKSPHPRYCRVKTFDTFNITLDSHGSVFQELLTAYEANLKRARVGGWVGGWVGGLTVIIRLISAQLAGAGAASWG